LRRGWSNALAMPAPMRGSPGSNSTSTSPAPEVACSSLGAVGCSWLISGPDLRLAADADDLAGDGSAVRCGQVGDRLGDIHRLATLAEAVEPTGELPRGKGHLAGHLGLDEARCDGVDGDAAVGHQRR